MIVILLVLVVGMLFGAALADRLFHAGATSTSRRALQQLECTLDGLETAYSIKAARLDAERALSGRSGVVEEDFDEVVVHLPQRHQSEA